MMRQNPVLALLLAAALLLAGCAGQGAAPTPAPAATATPEPAEQERVTIGFAAQEYERQSYEPLIAQFESENPGVRVRFVAIDDIMRELGQGGDIAQINRRIVSAADTAAPFFIRPEDAQSGIFADLRPLVDADPAFDEADFLPGALGTYNLDGGLFALPRTVNVQLISYNRDLFAAAGASEPGADLTWDGLLALAEQLGARRGEEVETYGYADWSGGMIPLLGLLGERGLDMFVTPASQLRLDDPAVEQALARIAALVESGGVNMPPEAGGAPSDLSPLIREGRVAMWPHEMLFTGPGAEPTSFERGVVPMPPTTLPLFGSGQSYVMSSGTEHPQEAWRWLSFLSRQDVRPPGSEGSAGQVPARRSAAEQSGYWAGLDEPTAAAVRAALERQPEAASARSFDGSGYQALNQALVAVVGGATPAEALREAQVAVAEQVAEAPPTPTPEAGPVVVTLPEEQVIPEGAARVRFGVFGMDPSGVRAAAESFNRANPELFVEVVQPQMPDGPQTLAIAAEGADCFSWFGAPAPGEITATLDLQPLADADASRLIDDYPPVLLAPFRQEGGLYGLPYGVAVRGVAYNQDAFEQAGLAPPSASWSLEDLILAAQQLTGGEGRDRRYGFGSMGAQTADLEFFVARAGGSLTTGSGDALAPSYTDERVFQGVSLYLDLLRTSSPHKRIQGYTSDGSWGGEVFQLMSEGRLGMWFDQGAFTFFGEGPGGARPRTAVVPPPGLDTLHQGDVEPYGGLYISASTEQAQACWRWLGHLSGDASAIQYGFPARISAAESEAFASRAHAGAAELYRAYRAAMERTPADEIGPARFTDGPSVDHFWFYRAADRALQGGDLERELEEAQRLAEEHLACVRGGGNPGECAVQVDPEYNGWNRPAQPVP